MDRTAGGDLYASTNANPNISLVGNDALLVWERKSTIGSLSKGINYYYGYLIIIMDCIYRDPIEPLTISTPNIDFSNRQ